MKRLCDPIWVAAAVVLSVAVLIVGFPAFEVKYGFPLSMLWTLAGVAGVRPTYFIRAYFWGNRK